MRHHRYSKLSKHRYVVSQVRLSGQFEYRVSVVNVSMEAIKVSAVNQASRRDEPVEHDVRPGMINI